MGLNPTKPTFHCKKHVLRIFSYKLILVLWLMVSSYLSGVHVELLLGVSPEIAILHVTLEWQDVLK